MHTTLSSRLAFALVVATTAGGFVACSSQSSSSPAAVTGAAPADAGGGPAVDAAGALPEASVALTPTQTVVATQALLAADSKQIDALLAGLAAVERSNGYFLRIARVQGAVDRTNAVVAGCTNGGDFTCGVGPADSGDVMAAALLAMSDASASAQADLDQTLAEMAAEAAAKKAALQGAVSQLKKDVSAQQAALASSLSGVLAKIATQPTAPRTEKGVVYISVATPGAVALSAAAVDSSVASDKTTVTVSCPNGGPQAMGSVTLIDAALGSSAPIGSVSGALGGAPPGLALSTSAVGAAGRAVGVVFRLDAPAQDPNAPLYCSWQASYFTRQKPAATTLVPNQLSLLQAANTQLGTSLSDVATEYANLGTANPPFTADQLATLGDLVEAQRNPWGTVDTILAASSFDAAQKAQLADQSALAEAQQIRLQAAMDRMSKVTSTLSNLMKKADDASTAIAGNLK